MFLKKIHVIPSFYLTVFIEIECRNADAGENLNPALAFRHRGQFGTANHGLVRLCPAIRRKILELEQVSLNV
jgi:hypothetical protein